ncbi:hypothetical protein K2173_005617 [Erythroxylum novogranatense]|uniref:Uncharacterized protein n=1 Tax=Erythroxylum novogranatense TaxID=1862640 RepID=A0AAV8SR11_9ROSI|nr:hypothetical protein K2173_005617 [Erythroxylum novogranatense]
MQEPYIFNGDPFSVLFPPQISLFLTKRLSFQGKFDLQICLYRTLSSLVKGVWSVRSWRKGSWCTGIKGGN